MTWATEPLTHLRRESVAIVRAAIDSVDPVRLVERRLHALDLPTDRVALLAAGKASKGMAQGALAVLGERVCRGLVIAPGRVANLEPLVTIEAEHPRPGPGSEAGGAGALATAMSVAADETLLVLISGGASSLMAMPAAGVSLDDKREATARLLRSGADIFEMNVVRKHISQVKGGRLAAACRGSSHTMVLSDVVGDDLAVIASGPTVADPSTFAEALAVLERYGGVHLYPPNLVRHLLEGQSGRQPESPKPGAAAFIRARCEVIGSRREAMEGARVQAEMLGYEVVVMREPVVGEARVAGKLLARQLVESVSPGVATCVIASGETTVHVTGNGIGGRNQELALSAGFELSNAGRRFVFASVGTDGIDGPTDAAGAIFDHTSLQRMADLGLGHPSAFLEQNNTYALFDALGDLVKSGPTGTNTGDIHVCLLA